MLRYSLALTLLLASVGCNQSATTPDAKATAPDAAKEMVIGGEMTEVQFNTAGLPTVSFDVPQMHCEVVCVPKVRDTLASQPGVKEVEVDLATKTATVAVEGESFDAEQAVAALEEAEFDESAVKTDSTDS